jgi:hypothetical protein
VNKYTPPLQTIGMAAIKQKRHVPAVTWNGKKAKKKKL